MLFPDKNVANTYAIINNQRCFGFIEHHVLVCCLIMFSIHFEQRLRATESISYCQKWHNPIVSKSKCKNKIIKCLYKKSVVSKMSAILCWHQFVKTWIHAAFTLKYAYSSLLLAIILPCLCELERSVCPHFSGLLRYHCDNDNLWLPRVSTIIMKRWVSIYDCNNIQQNASRVQRYWHIIYFII